MTIPLRSPIFKEEGEVPGWVVIEGDWMRKNEIDPLATLSKEDYEEFRSVFVRVLANMARRGLTVSPSDGLDLIHDFFAESWDGICRRYDPARGNLVAYVATAFRYFARTRIVRLKQWRRQLVGPLFFATQSSDVGGCRSPTSKDEADGIRSAVTSIDDWDRVLLMKYVGTAASERDLAREAGVSRHRVRESLRNSLGRVAVRVSLAERTKPRGIQDLDWKVALVLWHQEGSVASCAKRLAITVDDVQRIRNRLLGRIASHVRSLARNDDRHLRGGLRVPEITTSLSDEYFASLWEQLDAKPLEPQVLEAVREHAEDIIEYLDRLSDQDPNHLENHAKRVAAFYEVISGLDDASFEKLAQVEDQDGEFDEERLLGQIFLNAFDHSELPEYVANLADWFGDLEKVDPQLLSLSWERPCMEAIAKTPSAKQQYLALAEVGITPVEMVEALETTSILFESYLHAKQLSPPIVFHGVPSVNWMPRRDNNDELLAILAQEVAATVAKSLAIGDRLNRYLLALATVIPYLYVGFRASYDEGVLRFDPVDEEVADDPAVRFGLGQVVHGIITVAANI